jgi:hypothetical protein
MDYYFGSLRNAKIALKTDAKLLSSWSTRKIITVLVQKHRSKEKLKYGTIRRDFPALLSAAEAYFGSWGKALYAAGIEPNLYFPHHTWRKARATIRRYPEAATDAVCRWLNEKRDIDFVSPQRRLWMI